MTDHVNPVWARLLLLLLSVWGADVIVRAAEAPPALPRPYVIVEAWHDREYCSDLYAYDFGGKLLRRLTQRPLPTCHLEAVSADGSQVTFVANASALYNLNMRWDSLIPLHAGNVEAVTIHVGGKGVAYVARGFEKDSGQFLHIQPLVAGAHFKNIEIPLTEKPQESVFAPDGKRLLLTTWSGNQARIDSCDLDEGRKIEPWLSDPKISYYEPTFAPDGRSVAAIRENLDTGEWAIVSKPWPVGDLKVLREGPRGVPLSVPIFTMDEQHLLFWQNGVLARMPGNGGEAEGIGGELDNKPKPIIHRGLLDRVRPGRIASTPLLVGQWLASIEHEKPDGKLVIIDVQTKERRSVPLPKGKLMSAVVVE